VDLQIKLKVIINIFKKIIWMGSIRMKRLAGGIFERFYY